MKEEELTKLIRKELKRFKGLSKKVLEDAGMDSTVGSKPGSQSLSEAAPKKTASVGPKATRSMKTRSAQSKAKASPRDLQAASKPMAKKMTVPSQANKGELSLDTPKKIGSANHKGPQPKERKQSASPKVGGTSAKKSSHISGTTLVLRVMSSIPMCGCLLGLRSRSLDRLHKEVLFIVGRMGLVSLSVRP